MGRKSVIKICSTIIIVGCVLTYALPNLFMKMVAIGFAAGAEGAFSALFTMMINEATSNHNSLFFDYLRLREYY